MERNFLRKIFKKQGKFPLDFIALFITGVLLMIVGGSFFNSNTKESSDKNVVFKEPYEKDDIEERLEEVLSLINGAGKVKVMITITSSNELVAAEEIKESETITEEEASIGDKRSIINKTRENSFVMTESADGSNSPLILKELEEKIEGIVIVAEGGDDPRVKSALVNAAQALFDVPAYKVQVFKMGNIGG